MPHSLCAIRASLPVCFLFVITVVVSICDNGMLAVHDLHAPRQGAMHRTVLFLLPIQKAFWGYMG